MSKKKAHSGATSNPAWYRKGRSGNPGGRPNNSRAPQPSAFDVLTEKTIIVTRHGSAREITVEEALQQRTYEDALAGKSMAQREVLKWILKREAWLAKMGQKYPNRQSRVISRPIPTTRMPHSCCSGSRRQIRHARNLARTGRSFSLSLGRFRRPSAADEAANA